MELYRKPPGISTRWSSFENPSAEKGAGGRTNHGAKGYAYDRIEAGETRTLLDVGGSGTIRRIWATVKDRSPEMLRALRLDFFWDGAATPAVSAPFGDFFGIGLGRRAAFECDLFSDPEGRSCNCFVPMPFRSGARITVTNESDKALSHLFYDIDFLLHANGHENDVLYFHAHWRRESPNEMGRDYEILPRVDGTGRYLGANIGIITDPRYEGSWWGEGEFKVWLDGDDDLPTLCGTGTEDYIGTAWGQGEFAHRTQGCPVADKESGQWCFYRYHLPDPVFFDQDCRVAVQTIGGCRREKALALLNKGVSLKPISLGPADRSSMIRLLDEDKSVTDPSLPDGWVNFYRQDDWSSTCYFYLNKPENGLPPLPPASERSV